MPKSTPFSNDLVALIFNAIPISNIADNAASSPLTNLFVSLHTANPGVGGSQLTSETAYTNYARIPIARSVGGWSVAAASANNVALAQFPQCGATGSTITHVAIGTALTGAGKVLYAGPLSASLAVANLIQPQFSSAALTASES